MSSDKFGIEHSNFKFHFATKPSQEQEKLAKKQTERKEIVKLSGFDKNTTKGWKVKPLLIPPVVSKHFTVIYMYVCVCVCVCMTYKFTLCI